MSGSQSLTTIELSILSELALNSPSAQVISQATPEKRGATALLIHQGLIVPTGTHPEGAAEFVITPDGVEKYKLASTTPQSTSVGMTKD